MRRWQALHADLVRQLSYSAALRLSGSSPSNHVPAARSIHLGARSFHAGQSIRWLLLVPL